MKVGWHKWEDELIKVRYPWGGSRAVQIDLNRTESAIVARAKYLKVERGQLNGYKPMPDWLNIQDIVKRTGHNERTITNYINEGLIQAIRIPKFHQGHDGVFVTPESFENFMNRKDIIKSKKQKERILNCHKIAEAKRQIKKELQITKQVEQLKIAKRKFGGITKGINRASRLITQRETILSQKMSDFELKKKDWLTQRETILSQKMSELETKISELRTITKEHRILENNIKKEKERFFKNQETWKNNFIKYKTRTRADVAHKRLELDRVAASLRVKETKLVIRENILTKTVDTYRLERTNDINRQMEKLAKGNIGVAIFSDKSHYVKYKDNGIVKLCHQTDNPYTIKFSYNPFVEGEPTCKKCLASRDKILT
jgi:hypothetical protein